MSGTTSVSSSWGTLFPPFAAPGISTRHGGQLHDAAELPPIEQFLDHLPSILDFLVDDRAPAIPQVTLDTEWVTDEDTASVAGALMDRAPGATVHRPPGTDDDEGWAISGWQSYDWNSLASLGADGNERAVADQAWGATDWGSIADSDGTAYPLSREHGEVNGGTVPPSADEVAEALDGIARRIRSGELMIDNLRGTPPEAAMAAALAVLLRMRG